MFYKYLKINFFLLTFIHCLVIVAQYTTPSLELISKQLHQDNKDNETLSNSNSQYNKGLSASHNDVNCSDVMRREVEAHIHLDVTI